MSPSNEIQKKKILDLVLIHMPTIQWQYWQSTMHMYGSATTNILLVWWVGSLNELRVLLDHGIANTIFGYHVHSCRKRMHSSKRWKYINKPITHMYMYAHNGIPWPPQKDIKWNVYTLLVRCDATSSNVCTWSRFWINLKTHTLNR